MPDNHLLSRSLTVEVDLVASRLSEVVKQVLSSRTQRTRMKSTAFEFVMALNRLVGFELRRSWTMTMRYRSEAALSFAFLIALFYGALIGAKSLALGQFSLGSGAEGFLLGFICWTLAIGGVSHVAHDIEEEAKTGTLESLFLAYPGPGFVFMARNLAALVVGIPTISVLFVILTFSTKSTFHFSPTALLPLLSLDLTASGIGFLLGALAILVKRVRLAVVVVQLVVISLMVTRAHEPLMIAALPYLPLAPDVEALRDLLIQGSSLHAGSVAILLLNGFAYFAVGLAAFLAAVRRARRLGLLGQH